jgi:IPT/TIG domain
VTWVSDGEITCIVPPGTGVGNDVSVEVNGRLDANFISFNYSAPIISSLLPSMGPTVSSLVTIFGSDFGVGENLTRYVIANDDLGTIEEADDTSIIVTLPSISGTNVEVCL